MSFVIRELQPHDVQIMADAFQTIGWENSKPLSLFERYLSEQLDGRRHLFLAFDGDQFCGYVTVKWVPSYEPFKTNHIPEVQDFNVLPDFRRRGIGSALMDAAEQLVAQKFPVIGIGVGMYPGYGSAQRLYVKRGYVPDGRGITYNGQVVAPMASVVNDDGLVLYFTKGF